MVFYNTVILAITGKGAIKGKFLGGFSKSNGVAAEIVYCVVAAKEGVTNDPYGTAIWQAEVHWGEGRQARTLQVQV